MESEETTEERQNNELDVLKSIFGDVLRDLRGKAVWNRWMPLNLTLTLFPQQGGSGGVDDYVQIDLHVICPRKYPNEVPQIILENAKGLPKNVLEELKKELKQKAKTLLGEVMIYELSQTTQAFLYKHNKPPSKSFYDEMLTRQKQLEEQKLKAMKAEQDRENQEIEKKIKQRKKILKSELRLKRERLSIESSDDSPSSNSRNSFSLGRKRSSSVDQEEIACNHKGPQVIDFSNDKARQVQRIRCLSHSHEGSVIYYHAMDVKSGELFMLLEWSSHIKKNEYPQIQKQIANVEQELNYLVKLKSPNLVHYVDMRHEFDDVEKNVIVYILQENVTGLTFTSFSNGSYSLHEDGIARLARGILSALEFLHRNNVIHRDVTASNVYLNSNGIVQVANYSVYKRILDLDVHSASINKYSKKTDIFKFGILILSLITGKTVSEDSATVPPTCSSILRDFFSRCLNKEEKERSTATQLLGHPFLQESYERVSPMRTIIDNTNDIQDHYPELPITNIKTLTRNDQPRIQRDFEIIQSIGKGAYGHVFEVRNRIDGNHYAIKQIELNPKNKQLNRKMTREVTLLAKLNHENVVRYYNAWIESGIIENDELVTTKSNSSSPKVDQQKKALRKDDLALLSPHIKEWSVSYEQKSTVEALDDESSDDDDEEWGVVMHVMEDDSESIQFEKEGSTSSSLESSKDSTQNDELKKSKTPISHNREIQFMYIQMEFCEKSTLRTLIDSGLYLDVTRIKQLFREIVEGLAHIHQQGMIHRDLKPVNIFLDSKGHIKIGDFGLATSNVMKLGETSTICKDGQGGENPASVHDMAVDGSLTGQIGTALYTAPELNSATKTSYTQKVDIYSLGIIYFEMCYKPLETQMERIKILSGLRSKEILFPTSFVESELSNQETLIRWLLNHDASKRPTSKELLQSDLVPQPILEEMKLKETFLKTLSNSQSKYYKYLIASCFDQRMTPAQDIDYNLALSACLPKSLQLFSYVKEVIESLCKLHGGQNLSTPLLLPSSKFHDGLQSCVKMMAHSGIIVSIPHDLRVSFARYVAWHRITTLRRYSIDRVYRERKVFDSHPRELYECAFDIVAPHCGSFMADAEVLYVVHEMINAFPGLNEKHFRIRLNHTSLIKAILLYCGIKERHIDIFKILSDAKEGEVTKFQLKAHLIKLGLSDSTIKSFFSFVDLEIPMEKIQTSLQMITRKKSSEAGILAKQSLQELHTIIENCKELGVTFNIVIAPGVVYNVTQYSGMMCQFVCELKKKRRNTGMDILAAGGRYDDMITYYRNMRWPCHNTNKDINQSAVGISVSFDILIQALQDAGNEDYDNKNLEVVVCGLGPQVPTIEKARILNDLRSAGIHCSLIEAQNLEDMQEQCTFLNVCHAIILKDNKPGMGVVRSWDRNKRFQENSINLSNVVEDFQLTIKWWKEKKGEQVISTKSEPPPKASCTILFITFTKLAASSRTKYEQQIKARLNNIIQHVTKPVYILALTLEASVIGDLGTYLNFKSEHEYQISTKIVIEMHPHYKKYLTEICHEIYFRHTSKGNPILVLYNITDSFVHFL